MTRAKRNIAYLLSMTLILTSLPTRIFAQNVLEIPSSTILLNKAESTTSSSLEFETTTSGALEIIPSKYIGDGYEVEFKVTNKWPGGFNGEFIIKNTGEKNIENWALELDFNHDITQIWNAGIKTHDGNKYVLKNLGYNQDIKVGESINVGFQAEWENIINAPSKYNLLGVKVEASDEEYDIDFKVTSDWGSAFNGEISITNNGEEVIEDWTLEFDFDKNIERFWTAEILEHDGEHYVIKNAGYNANIEPGQTLRLGFGGNPGNVESEPENYVLNQVVEEIDYEKDSDEDGLPDIFEKELGTDLNNEDSDGDGLPDGYEYLNLGTDPLKVDSDDNGISDGEEDFDEDGLVNLEEYILQTSPHNDDTDGDDLKDKDEVVLYKSNPLDTDTDDDKLDDGDEIVLGFNILNPDTDGDGILDGDEKIYQIYSENISEQEKPEIVKVSVAFEGSGNLQKTTNIDNMYNIDVLSSEVVGIVGVPVEINTTSKFDKATITFEYDESRLGNVPEENLCVMWYDEEQNWYEILDQSSIVDTENNTVSVETTHFSTYLVVDREAWYEVWRKDIKYSRNESGYDVALVIDKSGSMSGTNIANVKEAAKNFVMEMYENDRVCVVAFNSNGEMINNLQIIGDAEDKKNISNTIRYSINVGGGTSTNAGLKMGLDELINNKSTRKQSIVLLCDGDVNDPTAMIKIAKEANINVHTINFGSGGETLLKKISDETGGKYCYARTAEEMLEAFYETYTITSGDIEKKDSDFDGIYDTYEIVGMQLSNGQIVTSDPFTAHSDTDGYSDFKEMEQVYPGILKYIGNNESGYVTYFSGRSNPRLEDSDGDGIRDNIDKEPLKANYIETLFELSTFNNYNNPVYIEVDENKVTITANILFSGDANQIFPGTEKTYAEIAVEGIENKWNKTGIDLIRGTEYDFVPGLKGELITNVIYRVPDHDYSIPPAGQKYLSIHIDNSQPSYWDENWDDIFGESHVPHMEGKWLLPNVGKIKMYKRRQGSPIDYLEYEYKAIIAHEFGHVLGLEDAYPDANGGKVLVNNEEISDGEWCVSGSIMYFNGEVYSNDIEMVLQAFSTNQCQFPMDRGSDKKSKVIRLPQKFK